jgi:aspartate/methionine/tyrosine aminotransferase
MSETITSGPDVSTYRLSSRGEELLHEPPFPEYLREHFRRAEPPCETDQAVDGYIPLCVAENKLVDDLLLPRICGTRHVPSQALGYDAMTGSRGFREALATFLSKSILKRRIAAECIAVLAGAGAILETLFYAIAEDGDGVLVPTPSYAGFWMDLQTRNRLTIVPVHGRSDDGFRITPRLLDRALSNAHRPIKALLFTSPSNPLGTVFSPGEIEEVLDWAEWNGLHVVFDEVYALSVFGDRPFTSVAALRPSLGEHLHIVWSFSKDFAASGLRCGVLASENKGVLAAVDALAYWACCSGDTQHLLKGMIEDETWVDGYVRCMQTRLRRAYGEVSAALTSESISFQPAEAGFFVLCDLRRRLAAPSWEQEDRLWRHLLREVNVNLTPGSACRTREPGYFRLCFASVSSEVVVEGIRRVAGALRAAS